MEILKRVGAQLFETIAPNEVLFKKEIYEVDQNQNTLKIYLPFAEKEELRLEQMEKEHLVGVQNEIRKFPVPAEFSAGEITGARFADGYQFSA